MEKHGDEIYKYKNSGKRAVLSLSDWRNRKMTQLLAPRSNICDLTDPKTRHACGVDVTSLLSADLSIPQAWGEAIALHPAQFDGLLYTSRFTDKPCLALFNPNRLLSIIKRQSNNLHADKEGLQFLEDFGIALR